MSKLSRAQGLNILSHFVPNKINEPIVSAKQVVIVGTKIKHSKIFQSEMGACG